MVDLFYYCSYNFITNDHCNNHIAPLLSSWIPVIINECYVVTKHLCTRELSLRVFILDNCCFARMVVSTQEDKAHDNGERVRANGLKVVLRNKFV